MSFKLRNLTVSAVEIDDLGLYIAANSDYDLREEPASDIATSDDLPAAISAGNLIVLDPLGIGSPMAALSISDSLLCVNLANDSHFRIRGGTLAQLDDVSSITPTDTQVLTYSATFSQWRPAAPTGGGGGGSPSGFDIHCFPFYRADGTYDAITVTSGLFPFFRANGLPDKIALTTCTP